MIGLETRLGDLLVERRLITQADLDEALAAQRDTPTYVPLGQLLIDRGLITRRQLHHLLEWTNKRPKLGEVLIKAGAIDESQLNRALEKRSGLGLPLGETLVKLGYFTDDVMRQALCLQMNVPYLDLERVQIDSGLARLINRTYATKHVLVPVSQVGQTLTVAMNDPSDLEAADELARSTGFVVRVVTSSLKSIRTAITRLYEPLPEPEIQDGLEVVDQSDFDPAIDKEYRSRAGRADEIVRQLFNLAVSRARPTSTWSPCREADCKSDSASTASCANSSPGRCSRPATPTYWPSCRGSRFWASWTSPSDGGRRMAASGCAPRPRPANGSTSICAFRSCRATTAKAWSCASSTAGKRRNRSTAWASAAFVDQLRRLLSRPSGIVLITGPTGSGKSTTLYAALMTLYRPQIRIVTAEDPIEYVYEQFSQSEVDERIGNTFASYLRAFLRHDPEVIMVGEMHDQETAEMALRAAQTGHLLLSTLHTSDAVSAVSRLLDMRVEPTLVGASLAGVLAQRLVRTVCKSCLEEYLPTPEILQEFFGRPPAGLKYYKGRGCTECDFTGYRGRPLVAELWTPSNEDVILINKGAPRDQLVESAAKTTFSMAESADRLFESGATNPEELMRMLPYLTIYAMRELAAR